jgi:adenylate cyclase
MTFAFPDGRSITVLPFVNTSEDTKQEFVGDRITEDIISALFKIYHFFVASRQSTFCYKGKPVKIRQVHPD